MAKKVKNKKVAPRKVFTKVITVGGDFHGGHFRSLEDIMNDLNKKDQEKDAQVKENPNFVATKTSVDREFASLNTVASEFANKLDLLIADTIRVKRLLEKATLQIEQPLRSIQVTREAFDKNL